VPAQYPCGPYGLTQGTVIANLSLPGKRDLNGDGSPVDDPPQTLQLSDYFHNQAQRGVVLSLAAEWCVPCRNEQPTLLSLYDRYKSSLGFLEAVVQDQLGNPAPSTIADNWATAYKIPFDIAGDPDKVLAPYYDVNSMPVQMVIRTRDMTIVLLHTGAVTEPEFQPILDAVAAGN
jgi:thiol-disulfide isomerase/thioredoxin